MGSIYPIRTLIILKIVSSDGAGAAWLLGKERELLFHEFPIVMLSAGSTTCQCKGYSYNGEYNQYDRQAEEYVSR